MLCYRSPNELCGGAVFSHVEQRCLERKQMFNRCSARLPNHAVLRACQSSQCSQSAQGTAARGVSWEHGCRLVHIVAWLLRGCPALRSSACQVSVINCDEKDRKRRNRPISYGCLSTSDLNVISGCTFVRRSSARSFRRFLNSSPDRRTALLYDEASQCGDKSHAER
jgi:hypothetical protein